MNFILQNEIYFKVINEITTPTGRKSEVQNIKYFYVVHRLNYMRLYRPQEYEIGVPMNYDILEGILSVKPTKLKQIFKWLIENNIIEKVKSYSAGYSSSLYKLHPVVEKMQIDTFSASDTESRLVQKINEHLDSFSMYCEVTNHQLDLMDGLCVSVAGKRFLEARYPDLSDWGEFEHALADPRDYDLVCIYLKDIYCRRNKNTKRAYSSLTSIPGNYRHYLELDGQPLYQIDLKNAQILLSVPTVVSTFKVKHGDAKPLTSDIVYFKHLAETGEFYEYMAGKVMVDISTETRRSNFKEDFFKQIFYSKSNNNKSTKLKLAFEQAFPNVADAIRIIKCTDYRQFAIQMQRFESEIFIDEVLRELYSLSITALSIHDSIVTTNIEDMDTAEQIIKAALMKFGLKPSFKKTNGVSLSVAA